MNMGSKFEINKIYSVQSDNYYFGKTCGKFKGYIYIDFKCIKRTNTFVTLERMKKISGNIPNIIRTKIKIDDKGNEYVFFERKILEA